MSDTIKEAHDVVEAMSRVIYEFAVGMTRETLKLHRQISALIDESEHFPTDESRAVAKAAIKESLQSGGEIERVLADVLATATSEDRDRLLRRLSEAAMGGAAAADEEAALDEAPGFVEGDRDDADLGQGGARFAGDEPADRVGAAAESAAEAAAEAVEDAAAEAAEEAAGRVGDAAKPRGVIRRFAKSVAGAATAAYRRTLGPALRWVGGRALALGLWMSTKPVLRQLAFAASVAAVKADRGMGALWRALKRAARGAAAAAKVAAYAAVAVLAVIGAAVVGMAIAVATGAVSVQGEADSTGASASAAA